MRRDIEGLKEALDALLKYSVKYIRQNTIAPGKEHLSLSSEAQKTINNQNLTAELLKTVNRLLNTDYNNEEFHNIIKKYRNKKSVNAHKIIQLLWDFINASQTQENIKNTLQENIKNLNPRSRFYSYKNSLLKLVERLSIVKNDTQRAKDKQLDLKNISGISLQNDISSAVDALKTILNNLSISIIGLDPKTLKKLFKVLSDNFGSIYNIIDSKSAGLKEADKTSLHNIIGDIISNIKIILSQIDIDDTEFNDYRKACLQKCKQIMALTYDTKKQLELAVKENSKKAYSKEAFELIYDNNYRIIKESNKIITKINGTLQEQGQGKYTLTEIPEDLLDLYENINIKSKKHFNKLVNEIKKKVENELNKLHLQKIFVKKWAAAVGNGRNFTLSEHTKNKLNEDLKKLNYNYLLNQVLSHNANTWKKHEKSIIIKNKKGGALKAKIAATPACDFKIFGYIKEDEGVNSNQRDTNHAINLWQNQVKSMDDKILFSALRHGNTRGKKESTKEIILAAAYQQFGRDNLLNLDSSEASPIKVKLGNIQLMSPTKGITTRISPDKDMPFQQIEQFKQYIEKAFSINIKDENEKEKTLWLQLEKPILVNFGTNIQYYMLNGAFITSFKKQNEDAFNTLFGKNIMQTAQNKYTSKKGKLTYKDFNLTRENFISQNADTGQIGDWFKNEKHKKDNEAKVLNLSKQILYLYYTSNKRGKKANPAAIQTRLAFLMYLIGYSVSLNCKSGKDRTGEVVAEINDLVLNMEANGGEPPDPYAKLEDEDRLQLMQVLDATSSNEIAQANTGFLGLKVGYKRTTDRFGGSLKGSSKNAKI